MSEIDVVVQERSSKYSSRFSYTEAILCRIKEPITVAKMAVEMVNRWGLVAAIPDGEDSAGRQKLRLQTPEELATHACSAAAALWANFEKRGWLIAVPEPRKVEEKETEDA